MEPVAAQEAVVAIAKRLMKDIVHALVRDGVGARTLRLALYRVDGAVTALDIRLPMPTRDATHVARLIDLKLERIDTMVDAGFGFEAVDLAVTATEDMTPIQIDLAAVADGDN